MPERFHVDAALAPGARIELPPRAARHVQVLRLQPGAAVALFDGRGGQWSARIHRMTRQGVLADVLHHDAVEREPRRAVTLAFGMPANDRMDTLIEKATELGAAALQPLVTERSVLRVAGERAQRKAAHWQAVAASACEQCGRNRLPILAEPMPLASWLAGLHADAGQRLLLGAPPLVPAGEAAAAGHEAHPASTDTDALADYTAGTATIAELLRKGGPALVLSGPEGGLSPAEREAALRARFTPFTLGARVLRADTAPLAALVLLLGTEFA